MLCSSFEKPPCVMQHIKPDPVDRSEFIFSRFEVFRCQRNRKVEECRNPVKLMIFSKSTPNLATSWWLISCQNLKFTIISDRKAISSQLLLSFSSMSIPIDHDLYLLGGYKSVILSADSGFNNHFFSPMFQPTVQKNKSN